MPAPATRPHPAMLTHLNHNPDVAHLMHDRIAVSHPIRVRDGLAASVTRRRPVRIDTIRIGDHRPLLAGMAALTALRAPRSLLPRPRLARIRRIARGRQRAVSRVASDLPLQPLHARDQLINPRRLRLDHRRDRISASAVHQIDLITPHTRKIRCNYKESFRRARRPPERLQIVGLGERAGAGRNANHEVKVSCVNELLNPQRDS